jgi:hypothetical protein
MEKVMEYVAQLTEEQVRRPVLTKLNYSHPIFVSSFLTYTTPIAAGETKAWQAERLRSQSIETSPEEEGDE